jgi:uncharacterized protein (DUF1810 family)
VSDLQRFVEAQARDYETALAELRAGHKRSHWIWYVFPQIAGLGFSPTSQFYAIASLEEARAYLAHPLLGPRLKTCVAAVLAHRDVSARAMLGSPDDAKFRSCLTLFAAADPDEPLFGEALQTFFGGEPDRATLDRLG